MVGPDGDVPYWWQDAQILDEGDVRGLSGQEDPPSPLDRRGQGAVRGGAYTALWQLLLAWVVVAVVVCVFVAIVLMNQP